MLPCPTVAQKDRAWLLFGLAVGAGIGIASLLSRPRPKLGVASRVLLIGDSMAQGLTPHLAALAKDRAVPFMGRSEVGTRIDQWTGARLDAALAAFGASPTLVLVALGTNDFYAKETHETLAAHVTALAGKLSEIPRSDEYGLGPDVLWIGPPLLQILDAPYDVIEQALREGYTGTGVAGYFASQVLDLRMGPDRIHPTSAGFASWAAAIWNRLS